MTTQPTALDTYLQHLPMIRDKIEALRQLTENHFGHNTDAIHWGHVGDLGRVDQAMDELLAIFDSHKRGATMDILPKLSLAQSLLLRTAARRADGHVIVPDTLRGGARAKVLTALLQRGWIEPADDGHALSDTGYAAIGQQRPVPKDDIQPVDAIDDLQLVQGITVRPGSKLAALVVALRRPQGATSLQLMLATGWQPHTVRGAISGVLRKKLGLNVVLALNDSGEQVYRVANFAVSGGESPATSHQH